jgi:hypothetical protein
MRPYLITAKLMRPSNMKRFPTPVLYYRAAPQEFAVERPVILKAPQKKVCSLRVENRSQDLPNTMQYNSPLTAIFSSLMLTVKANLINWKTFYLHLSVAFRCRSSVSSFSFREWAATCVERLQTSWQILPLLSPPISTLKMAAVLFAETFMTSNVRRGLFLKPKLYTLLVFSRW